MREAVSAHVGGFERRGRHAERGEHALAHVARVRHPGHVGDDAAEEGEAVVAVFVARARSGRERDAGADHRRELGLRGRELLVAPRVVFGEAFGVREQVADGDLRRIVRGVPEAGEFGHIPLRRVVEREEAGVAELEDGERREALRHRRDAEHGARIDGGACRHVAESGRARMHEPPVDDDPVGDARHAGPRSERAHQAVDGWERCL